MDRFNVSYFRKGKIKRKIYMLDLSMKKWSDPKDLVNYTLRQWDTRVMQPIDEYRMENNVDPTQTWVYTVCPDLSVWNLGSLW